MQQNTVICSADTPSTTVRTYSPCQSSATNVGSDKDLPVQRCTHAGCSQRAACTQDGPSSTNCRSSTPAPPLGCANTGNSCTTTGRGAQITTATRYVCLNLKEFGRFYLVLLCGLSERLINTSLMMLSRWCGRHYTLQHHLTNLTARDKLSNLLLNVCRCVVSQRN